MERDHAEDIGFEAGLIKSILEKQDYMEWIDLALDREKRQALMNNVKSFRVQ